MKIQLQKDGIFLKLMRISITQLCLALLCVGLSYAKGSYAQELLEKRITLRAEEKSIKTILSKIESESNLKFVYSPASIKADRIVSINVQNKILKDVLENLFVPLEISYRVSGEKVILRYEKREKGLGVMPQNIEKQTNLNVEEVVIKGRVVSGEKKDGVPGVSVLIKGTNKGTITDMDGRFTVNVDLNVSKTLVFSGVGYKKIEKTLDSSIKEIGDIELTEDNLQLDQVVVTGSGTPKSKLESSVAVTSISSKQLDLHPPVNSMDLLRNIPGISVESSGGDGPGTGRVRGLPLGGFALMGVMEDGTALVPTGFVSTPSADQLYKVDLTIKNVEAVRGGDAAMLQPSTAGMLMNILSKTGGDKFEMQAKYTRGLLQNSNRFDVNFGGPLAPHWKYNIGGSYRTDKGIKPANYMGNIGGQIKANTTYEFKNNSYVRLQLKYLNDKTTWFVPSYYSYDGSGQGNAFPTFDPLHETLATRDYVFNFDFNGKSYSIDQSEGVHSKLFSAALDFKYNTKNEWTIRNNMKVQKLNYIYNFSFVTAASLYKSNVNYYNLDGTTYTPAAGGYYTGQSFFGTKSSVNQFMDNLDISKQIGKNAISFGASIHSYSSDLETMNGVYNTPIANNPQILRIGTNSGNGLSGISIQGYQDGSQTISSVWANDETNLGKLSINVGVRANNYHVQGNRLINKAPYNTYTPFDNTELNWTYTLGLNYKLNEKQAIFGRGTRSVAALNLNDYSGFTFNPATLTSREVIMAEAGYKLNTEKFSLFTSFVYATLKNAASSMLVPSNTAGFLSVGTFASSRNLSAEIEAIYNVTKNFKLRSVATFQNSKYTDFSVTAPANAAANIAGKTYSWSGQSPERIPRMIGELTATYTMNKFDVFATYRYIGKRWSSPANLYLMNGYNDASAGINFKATKNISVRVWGDNLFDSRGLTEGNIRGDQFLANGNFAQGSPQIGRIILPRGAWAAVMFSL